MRILITAKNSFIGNSFASWVSKFEPSFEISKLSLRNQDLQKVSFKDFDVVFHVAGIAHIRRSSKLISHYFSINRDLAIEVAKKSKSEGVSQFIFTSSIAIYGNDNPINKLEPISIDKPKPNDAYGQSKLEADIALEKLNDINFKTVILRLPMVYGNFSKGNYSKLLKLAKLSFLFPNINNRRSVLHVNNLSSLLTNLIKNKSNGIFYPQDELYLNTIQLIKLVRKNRFTIYLNNLKLLSFLLSKINIFNKIFGNRFYIQEISNINSINYQIENIYSSIL